jgi:hypothetical protein
MLQRAEQELSPGENFEGKVPFAPHLTPLGRERLDFTVAERYDLLSPKVPELLAAASEWFFFSGLSLKGWASHEGFLSLLREKASRNVECRILLMSPDNPAISQMLSGVSNQEERIRKDIKESYEKLQSRESHSKIAVRLKKRGIPYQQMSMSEQAMIWAPHLYCKQTGQSPAIRVDKTRSLRTSGLEYLYNAMREEFERLWNENAP